MSKARLVITAVTVEGLSQGEAARRYGVSQGWVSKLLARYRDEGDAAFEPRSRRPKTSPNATAPEAVELITALRKDLAGQGLDAGPQTIAWHLEHRHQVKVSAATVSRTLGRQGLVTPDPGQAPPVVLPAVRGGHAALDLYVADEDMRSAEQPPWALARRGRASVFEPQLIGYDPRGRTAMVTLMFKSGIIGALPRMGKTFLPRLLLLLICVLDPRVEVHGYDLKGTGDLAPMRPVAHRYRAGDEEEDLEYLLNDLRDLYADLPARARAIREIAESDPQRCPENKITDVTSVGEPVMTPDRMGWRVIHGRLSRGGLYRPRGGGGANCRGC